ncbi:MAG: hypothetical protein RMJ43_02710 [Chloroherpetonaceae bacterium]|nr:hypothetical protein [Chthonomonadaceae bacterium]MDW8206722.1 hypothetical protein [Chloroherpetonaceae bacterium]
MNEPRQQCAHCGTLNTTGAALCVNCHMPLTAYGGQVTGLETASTGRLAERVQALIHRPPVIYWAAGFNLFIALFWPVAALIRTFISRPQVNEEGTNYIVAALGAMGPVFATVLLLPLALLLLAVAWGIGTQQPWAWRANIAVLAGFALFMLTRVGTAPISLVWLAVAGVIAFFWLQPRTRAWFALD